VVNDNSSEKVIVDEQTHKSLSPPLSLSSTSENTTTTTTTTTSTSEDDFDDKDSNDLAVVIDNHVPTDCNQLIV
ncbi:unnamed protein product, partial [Rotaria magnacalcarata]